MLRAAALCHDLGHLPLSHAAEELLPNGWNHEYFTVAFILSEPIRGILMERLRVTPRDVAKLAVGPEKFRKIVNSLRELGRHEYEVENKFLQEVDPWEGVLSEIIIGDAFGVDRIDYLLRDAYHANVAYGQIEYRRLIESIRILPSHSEGSEYVLGVLEGGVRSVQELLWARYLMYNELYFHPVRRIYDIHLRDFLQEWLSHHFLDGRFPTDLDTYLQMTDHDVESAIQKASMDPRAPGHEAALCITNRKKHYRLVYRPRASHIKEKVDWSPVQLVYDAICKEFGEEIAKFEPFKIRGNNPEFTVFNKRTKQSLSSTVYFEPAQMPVPITGAVYVLEGFRTNVLEWLTRNIDQILDL
jgi:hypothetical protein